MTTEPSPEAMSADERARVRRQTSDQAVKLAISGRWDEAANLNRELIRIFGEEAESLNRLGKALTELGQPAEARKAYARSLDLEPTNTIARRNLDKLGSMEDTVAASQPPSQLDTRLFIEETGKSAVATLQAVDPDRLGTLDAGDIVSLRVQGKAVNVHNTAGDYIGMVQPRVGLRLARMMAAGNQYTAAIVTTTDDVKVILRETFQNPAMIGKVSFPQARATADVRGYTRRGLLRTPGDEVDYSEDDEPEDDEPEDTWSEVSEEANGTVEVDVEPEDEGFD